MHFDIVLLLKVESVSGAIFVMKIRYIRLVAYRYS